MKSFEFFVGFDSRMQDAYAVAARSLVKAGVQARDVHPLVLSHLQGVGLYTRPMHEKEGVIMDEISGAPNSSEFSISRFLAPLLTDATWAIFCDSDFLFRKDIGQLLNHLDETKALMCVKHDYNPVEAVKMQGQVQTRYNRKNWSSLMAFNTRHPSNQALTPALINTMPGRDLHRFCWLSDDEIGALPDSFNWLEGHSTSTDPAVVHFTRGTPDMPGYETAFDGNGKATDFAQEWRVVLAEVTRCRKLEN